MTSDDLKRIVAERAVDDYVKDGMKVGLGTGSTAYHAIRRVGRLVRENGYNLTCVATSSGTEGLAREYGIDTVSINEVGHLDVTIDGADEVDPEMQLIKGLGGALLREKIVAAASRQEIIVVDESKKVDVLGTRAPLPVEVLAFGHPFVKTALERQGCVATLRMSGGLPFVTDGGNYIYDCKFESINNPFFLESRINVIPGVVDNGLFLNLASTVLVSSSDGTIERKGH
ncbi:MAG: ribose-5-phosphate isomerase RpiA [Candidatus Methanomethylophilaceae archaeon]|jgi:ribose 5-phosphate isomerase A|nr:ribose-5-phosphate isomerase RpiA [Candidatus Methanomethylophilaceae archaeon]NLF34086.1 ribose-5-phosphate isomerase RpiA [Thermoplasmatales archaeon]